jgi:hypothetical protein
MIDLCIRSGYLAADQLERGTMSDPNEQRIAREEEYWTGPRLFGFGLVFLGICIVAIYLMATFSFASTTG